VRQLAAKGHSGDVIASKLGVNKNYLRAEHALDLEAGREINAIEKEKAEANAIVLSMNEEILLEVIRTSFADGDWIDEDGTNLLFGDARSEREAFERCQSFGHFRGLSYDDLRADGDEE
jgi:hypothetical protein